MGLERDVDQVSSKACCMVHTRWCYSMAGDEFARLYAWGNDPRRKVRPEKTDMLLPTRLMAPKGRL